MTRRRQSGARLSRNTLSARLPHPVQRSRHTTVAKVMPGSRRDTGTALAGHLPQSPTRVRQAQQPRQMTTSRQVAKSATSDPSPFGSGSGSGAWRPASVRRVLAYADAA